MGDSVPEYCVKLHPGLLLLSCTQGPVSEADLSQQSLCTLQSLHASQQSTGPASLQVFIDKPVWACRHSVMVARFYNIMKCSSPPDTMDAPHNVMDAPHNVMDAPHVMLTHRNRPKLETNFIKGLLCDCTLGTMLQSGLQNNPHTLDRK